MQPIRLQALTPEELAELDQLYRTTRQPHMRTRAQIILLAAEQGLTAPQIAPIVRKDERTVRRWIRRYNAEGAGGLSDEPRPGSPGKVTPAFTSRLLEVVRRRPRALGLEFSLWTLERLADFMAEETSIRVSYETVRVLLKRGGIALSRPQHKITSPDPEYAVKKRRLKTRATP